MFLRWTLFAAQGMFPGDGLTALQMRWREWNTRGITDRTAPMKLIKALRVPDSRVTDAVVRQVRARGRLRPHCARLRAEGDIVRGRRGVGDRRRDPRNSRRTHDRGDPGERKMSARNDAPFLALILPPYEDVHPSSPRSGIVFKPRGQVAEGILSDTGHGENA